MPIPFLLGILLHINMVKLVIMSCNISVKEDTEYVFYTLIAPSHIIPCPPEINSCFGSFPAVCCAELCRFFFIAFTIVLSVHGSKINWVLVSSFLSPFQLLDFFYIALTAWVSQWEACFLLPLEDLWRLQQIWHFSMGWYLIFLSLKSD